MRMMGIDYGSKRVGIAITDESGSMAFPKAVISNDRYFFRELKSLIESHGVKKIILGESVNRDGSDNTIMQDIRRFAQKIHREMDGVEVDYETEMYTSEEAKRLQGDDLEKNTLIDASAAAIILNSYIEKSKHT